MHLASQTTANRKLRVRAYTNTQVSIVGDITMTAPADSYRGRVLDYLNDSRSFIAVTDAQVYTNEGKFIGNVPFLSINKQSITLLMEEESSDIFNQLDKILN